MRFTIIIPTRYDSQCLPGKALRVMAGMPMIRHVYERTCEGGAAPVATLRAPIPYSRDVPRLSAG